VAEPIDARDLDTVESSVAERRDMATENSERGANKLALSISGILSLWEVQVGLFIWFLFLVCVCFFCVLVIKWKSLI
jgi:uncharacterized membrane protein